MDPFLGDGSVSRPTTYEYATIECRSLLGNGVVKPLDIFGNVVFYEVLP
jgi:hypothetical protein